VRVSYGNALLPHTFCRFYQHSLTQQPSATCVQIQLVQTFSTYLRSLSYNMLALLTHWYGIYCLTGKTSIVYIKDIIYYEMHKWSPWPFCASNSNAETFSTQWTYNGGTTWYWILQKDFRILYSKDLWDLYQSPRQWPLEARRVWWTGYADRMGEKMNANKILVWQHPWKIVLRLRRWKGNINTDVSETASEYQIWMKLVKMNFGISNTEPSDSAASVTCLVIQL
jgi:hypothetical protein